MPKGVKDGVDNTEIRLAVLRARATREISLSGLSRELGYVRPNINLLKRMLGINQYIEKYSRERATTYAIKRSTAERIWSMISDEPAAFEVPPEGWGNGTDMVLVEPIRLAVLKACEEGRTSLGKIAQELGYVTADTAPLRRMLGLKKEGKYRQRHINYDTAVWITYRLGLDPTDTGV